MNSRSHLCLENGLLPADLFFKRPDLLVTPFLSPFFTLLFFHLPISFLSNAWSYISRTRLIFHKVWLNHGRCLCQLLFKNSLLIWNAFLMGVCKGDRWLGNGVILGSASRLTNWMRCCHLGQAFLNSFLYEHPKPCGSIRKISLPYGDVPWVPLRGEDSITSSQYLNCLGR